MAITKIHPIKSTLNLAINYITKGEKTDNEILVSAFKCNPITAHTSFIRTREDKQRFTRAKTIGEDYTEERLKERLQESVQNHR